VINGKLSHSRDSERFWRKRRKSSAASPLPVGKDEIDLKGSALVQALGGGTSVYKRDEKHESPEEERHRHKIETRDHWFRLILISGILGFVVWIASTSASAEDRKWSFGVIGSIVRYAVRGIR
jgi:hypothetical protein